MMKTVIEMAVAAGSDSYDLDLVGCELFRFNKKELELFAALVREDEREKNVRKTYTNFGQQEPVAWEVYVEQCNNSYIVDSLDDPQLIDDCTNHAAVVTPLYTTPPTIEAAVLAEREACAKVCDEVLGVNNVSAAIRSRSDANK